eukprot:Partr_v1_DN26178_c0_g1_i6_m10234 putative chromosome 12 open reading frame 10
MIASAKRLKTNMLIGTHSGSFHADESLACFLLHNTAKFAGADIVRTRDPDVLATCDVVVDVGGVYDPEKNLYDHHQKEFQDTMTIGDKKYATRLSSAGLVYRHFGHEVIAKICDYSSVSDERVSLLYRKMYDDFVEAFDGIDNGVNQYPSNIKPAYRESTNLASRVGRLLPWWNEDADDYDERFKKAVAMCGQEFTDRLKFMAFAWLPARQIVQKALNNRFKTHASGRVLKLDQSLPWKVIVFY